MEVMTGLSRGIIIQWLIKCMDKEVKLLDMVISCQGIKVVEGIRWG